MTRELYEELKNSNLYKTEIEKKITNQENLSTLTAEECYNKMVWLFQDYGKSFQDSRAAIIEWLNSEGSEDKK